MLGAPVWSGGVDARRRLQVFCRSRASQRGVSVAGDLSESDTASQESLDRLNRLVVTYLAIDFGHPLGVEPVLGFAEWVITPMTSA